MAKSIKKGDEVVVIAGDHKSKKGKVLQVLRDKSLSAARRNMLAQNVVELKWNNQTTHLIQARRAKRP